MRRSALLATTEAVEKIAHEMKKSDSDAAIAYVPDVVTGMKQIRSMQAKIVGDETEERANSDKNRMEALGPNPPAWLLDLCEEYVLTWYRKSLENGNYNIAFSKMSITSQMNDKSRLCLSVLQCSVKVGRNH